MLRHAAGSEADMALAQLLSNTVLCIRWPSKLALRQFIQRAAAAGTNPQSPCDLSSL